MTIPRKVLSGLCGLGLALFSVVARARADQVEMQNGDRYNGKVLSLNADTVTLRSDVLGTVNLPRGKVALIALGTSVPAHAATTNAGPPKVAAPRAGVDPDLSSALRQLGSNSNLIQQVQAQFLAGAGPQANSKFTELLDGLSSGKVGIAELRAQASAAADQLRALKHELGDGGDTEMDGYLSILDDFLKETAPAGSSGASGGSQPQSAADAAH